MLESQDEGYISKPILGIYSNENSNSTKYLVHNYVKLSNFSSSSMKKSVRPIFSFLLLIVLAATFGCRVAIKNGFGSIYWESEYSFVDNVEYPPLNLPIFNTTLLKLAEIEVGETQLRKEIQELLEANDANIARFRAFPVWRRYTLPHDPRARISTGIRMPGIIRSSEFSRVWLKFKRSLREWSMKKRFEPNILEELVDLVKVPIDEHNGVFEGSKRKYKSCAVVGNSGILLSKEYGELIDSHEIVIRLNNARIEPFLKNVGYKTSISFINSNILHLCTRRDDCYCHPYGSNVPIVMYMCQPAQFLDYVECSSSHKSPLIVTDPRFDMLCARIVKYYSLKRFGDGPNRTLEEWSRAHDGDMFHYSSGMQAVMLGLGVCDRVSLFGFGKSIGAKHHYHTNQKQELSLHDYEAEYDFYRDLVERPRAIPFISSEFKFPPVVIYR